MLQAIKVVAIFSTLSFLSMGLSVALFPDNPFMGVATFVTLSSIYPIIKIKKLKPAEPGTTEKDYSLHGQAKRLVDKLEKIRRDQEDIAKEVMGEQDSRREFKPWTDERLLWSGKRKLTIDYINGKSKRTTRDIDLLGIWPHSETGEIYFRARCHLRDEWRTFKAENASNIRNARKKEFPDFFSYMSEELKI